MRHTVKNKGTFHAIEKVPVKPSSRVVNGKETKVRGHERSVKTPLAVSTANVTPPSDPVPFGDNDWGEDLDPYYHPYLERYGVTPENYEEGDETWAMQGPGVFESREQWKQLGVDAETATVYHYGEMSTGDAEPYVQEGFDNAYEALQATRFSKSDFAADEAALWAGKKEGSTFGFAADTAAALKNAGWNYEDATSHIEDVGPGTEAANDFVENPPERNA